MPRKRNKPKILCVDDDRNLLEGIRLQLRRTYEVIVAESGAEGLEMLTEHADTNVVISDMRMPEMDGADFLSRVKVQAPNAIRVLLTGFSDYEAAVRAVNEGEIFRFLSKPCQPEELKAVLAASVNQYELIQTEKTLLNHTLLGCVRTMLEVTAFAAPDVRRKAQRIQKRIGAIAKANDLLQRWQLELAASLSQLGRLSVLDELETEGPIGTLSADAVERLRQSNVRVAEMLAVVPRLEGVASMLRRVALSDFGHDKRSRLLAAVIAMEDMMEAGQAKAAIAQHVAEEFGDDIGALIQEDLAREQGHKRVDLDEVRVGMTLAQDLRTSEGILLAFAGIELDDSAIAHLKSYQDEITTQIEVVAA